MIALSLQYKEKLFYCEIESSQKMTYGSGKKDTVQIHDMVENQIVVNAVKDILSVSATGPFRFSQSGTPVGKLISIDNATYTTLFSSRATGISKQRYKLPHNGIVKIGRAENNNISIGLPFISENHFQLRVLDGYVRVEDLNSANGTYLNGLKIKAAIMNPGDVINLFTIRIKLINNELQFENIGNALRISDDYSRDEINSNRKYNSQNDRYLKFRLSPRLQDQLPQSPIILDRPPKKGQEYHPSRGRIASMLSMGAMAGTTFAMGMVSPALAFSRMISMAAGFYNMAASSKMEKQRQAEMEEYNRRRDEEYKTYIEAQQARIVAVASEQRRIISDENPEPSVCMEMVQGLDRRIWERMISDRDFLDVRLGMGYEELCVPIKNYAENRGLMMEDDELEDLCNNIAEENRIVDYIPVRLPLRSTTTIGVLGNRDQSVHMVRNMIVSLTAQHSPDDLQIVGIFDNKERAKWASLRWLPHVWDRNKQFRYISFDSQRAHSLCEMINDILKRRLDASRDDYNDKKPAPLPHFVVIVGGHGIIDREPLMNLLTSNNQKLGVSTIFMYDEIYYLPQECSFFIDLTDEFPSIYGKKNVNKKCIFSKDTAVTSSQFGSFARRMAAIEMESNNQINALPSSITFLDGLNVKKIEDLNILERWRKNIVTDSLAAPIGVMANGNQFCLDIHYKSHGAHGLIAGTTGSGKSELLRTWILSMAVNYHPHYVNFVIIDYKGGGMANKLEALPHVVGKITNIDSNISRSLVSLKREAKRRMKLLESYPGVDDIDQYLQLHYSGKAHEPMPHLIIVSDEFAELKKEEPEFMKELSSLARVGRSVGIHLVLATQRPTGVVDDQIDSNSRFRICMKVNSIQDSKELLKRPEAAGITQRGRAYVRIGEDEMFDLFQSYWSGAEYTANKDVMLQYTNQVSIVDVSGERIQSDTESIRRKQNVGIDQLSAIVTHISEQAKVAKIEPLKGPWKPELPAVLPLHMLEIRRRFTGAGWPEEITPLRLDVPIGIYDQPSMQAQGVRCMEFTETTHYGIYGGPATGKTTLLKTMILSMGMQFSPSDVNLYILDFGGRSLSVFNNMPHVSMVIQENEEDKLIRFMEHIQAEIARRKLIFEKEKVSNFNKYWSKKNDMPAIFIVIDNLLRLSTIYNETDAFLIDLSITGSDCGIHLVFTSNNINKTSMNLRTNIGGCIALHMTDYNDYRVAVSEFPEGSKPPSNPGRALMRDSSICEMQTAIYMESEEDGKNQDAIEILIGNMKKCWSGKEKPKIKSVPDSVTVADMAEYYITRNILPIGIDYAKSEPLFMNLEQKHCMLVSSLERQDGSEFIKSIAELLATRSDNQIYVLDGNSELSELIPRSTFYATKEKMNQAVALLGDELCRRENALFEQQCESGISGENSLMMQYPQICIIINEMHMVMQALSDENQSLLLNICHSTSDLGVIAIASGCTDDISRYMYTESLTIAFVDNPEITDASSAKVNWQKGVCIGGKIRNHNYFVQNMLSAEEKSKIIASGDGIVFDCGRVIRIKRMKIN